MDLRKGLAQELKVTEEFFNRSTNCLTEENSAFAPQEVLYTVAGHVTHTAQTIEWFSDGAFNSKGFDMNFDDHIKEARETKSLQAARDRLKNAFAHLAGLLESKSEADWLAPIAEGPIMGGQPRFTIFSAIVDHCAHHRGALTVYSRLLGKVPAMPYMDM